MTTKEKLKDYIKNEYQLVRRGYDDPQSVLTRCYGAMMFTANTLLNEKDREEIFKWWDNEILFKFRYFYHVI